MTHPVLHKINRFIPVTVAIKTAVFGTALFFCLFIPDAFSSSAIEMTFDLSDSRSEPCDTPMRNEIIHADALIKFDIPALIFTNLKIDYQGASAQDLGYKLTFYIPQISPAIADLQNKFPILNGLLGLLSAQLSWKTRIPSTAWGQTTAKLIAISSPDDITIIERRFSVLNSAIGTGDVPADAFACSACHPGNYYGWASSRRYPDTACSACHGDPADHSEDPTAENIDLPDERICANCHQNRDVIGVASADAMIRPMQQSNELTVSVHKNLTCLDCHDPHYSPSAGIGFGVVSTCENCHPDRTVNYHDEDIRCVDCHMPYAVVRDRVSGSENFQKGDVRSHLFRISGRFTPEEMFSGSGTRVAIDEGTAFVTLNFACQSCHNGIDAKEKGFAEVQQANPMIHY